MIQPRYDDAPTILIIENDQGNRILAEYILKRSGYRHLSAADGPQALALLEQGHIDLILTDLAMPGIDGFRLTRLIRQRAEYGTTPIIALTGMPYSDDRQRALRAGCADILVKPYRGQQLLDMISRYLPVHTSSGAKKTS